ncbi:MAG: type II toxin-antitoxin system PemK/MazF family toxin [Reichenbachiella sp.]|uniref:type II toxin-antitoxin system PemK/MazF family toxin n=1 Tax=Reichenbachiella sp. TaxID=2184521 RepID=UPI002966DE65|nr:type II toxin-antitoxin system PemK/MazF family toxin [Reichenbachiella sp.]MDW3208286.1 type II toxin-antitoxin system PemK/MazF family toxin [Reichenbachiella sp.]
MRQGEIWELYLDPVKDGEQSGRRPAVIISGNLLNQKLQVVIVCPLTTSIKAYKGNVILEPDQLNNLPKVSEVLTFHIRSVAKARLKKRIGYILPDQVERIKNTLGDILRY